MIKVAFDEFHNGEITIMKIHNYLSLMFRGITLTALGCFSLPALATTYNLDPSVWQLEYYNATKFEASFTSDLRGRFTGTEEVLNILNSVEYAFSLSNDSDLQYSLNNTNSQWTWIPYVPDPWQAEEWGTRAKLPVLEITDGVFTLSMSRGVLGTYRLVYTGTDLQQRGSFTYIDGCTAYCYGGLTFGGQVGLSVSTNSDFYPNRMPLRFYSGIVPEPSTYAMLGLGLGLLGFRARRK